MSGKACIKGTRVFVSIILDWLAEGMSEDEILENYSSVKREHIQATFHYNQIELHKKL